MLATPLLPCCHRAFHIYNGDKVILNNDNNITLKVQVYIEIFQWKLTQQHCFQILFDVHVFYFQIHGCIHLDSFERETNAMTG